MSDDKYRFTVGDFECLVIKDSMSSIQSEQIFSNVDKSIYTPLLEARGEKSKQFDLHINTLAVFSDDWVLIDTGYGNLGMKSGQVAKILEDEDIRPEHVILSHVHPDHYGGLMDDDGNEAFGNVPIYMCQSEWMLAKSSDYAQSNPILAGMIQKHLIPIERQIEPIECLNMNEILPGLSVIRLPGHTYNHIGILIESQGERLIYAGDTLIHPLHLEHLDWQFGFDNDHDQARLSRIKLAEFALELDALVMPCHFEFPALGKIEQSNSGYTFIPISE